MLATEISKPFGVVIDSNVLVIPLKSYGACAGSIVGCDCTFCAFDLTILRLKVNFHLNPTGHRRTFILVEFIHRCLYVSHEFSF